MSDNVKSVVVALIVCVAVTIIALTFLDYKKYEIDNYPQEPLAGKCVKVK